MRVINECWCACVDDELNSHYCITSVIHIHVYKMKNKENDYYFYEKKKKKFDACHIVTFK